jgi:hypothetical protein
LNNRFTEGRIAIHIYIDKVAVETTSVGLAQARPN